MPFPRSLVLLVSFVLATIAVPGQVSAQWTHTDSVTSVYLVTAGPGGDFFTWFGHAAIIVHDGERRRSYWYDYGIIEGQRGTSDARTGGIRARVVRTSSPSRRIKLLEADDRTVLVQELMLPQIQREELVRLLDADVEAYGKTGYDYRHIEDNCTTRIRDVIDRASGGALRRAVSAELADRTIREHGYRRFVVRSMPFTMFADLVTGNAIDRPMTEWDAMFLPEELARQTGRATLPSGEPLAIERYRVASRQHELPSHPPHHHLPLALIGMTAGAIALFAGWKAGNGQARWRTLLGVHASISAVLLGVPGLFMVLAWAATDLTFMHTNENVLLANPLFLVTLPFAVGYTRGSDNAERVLRFAWITLCALALVAILAKPLPGFRQDNWRVVALILPLSLSLAVAFRLASRQPLWRIRATTADS